MEIRAEEWDDRVKLRLARLCAGGRANLIGIFSKFDACGLALALLAEQADLYSGPMRIEQAKIDVSGIPRSAERMRQTRKSSLIWFLSNLTIFPLSRC